MPRWLITLLRLTPIVATASAASVVGLIAFRAVAPMADLHAAVDALGNYLQTVGSIYAVLLAFVVYVVWGQYNDARGLVDREATALVDLHRTATALPVKSRAAIQLGLREYVTAVLRDEWPAMTKHDEQVIEKVGHKLDEVWVAIHHCKPTDTCQHTVYGEVLSQFNELTDLRTSRLISAQFRIPVAMKILLYTGALLVVGSMYLVAVDQLWLHALVTAALAGAIAHILYLIVDLDNVFAGTGHVSKRPFERALLGFDRAVELVPFDSEDA